LAARLALGAVLALAVVPGAAAVEVPEPIVPLPQSVAVDSARAPIGERSFRDVRPAHDNATAEEPIEAARAAARQSAQKVL
jgi:hypothetical protein